MDHPSYYASKINNYMFGSVNYQLPYENPCTDYPLPESEPYQSYQSSHGYDIGNGGGIGNVNSVMCNGNSNNSLTVNSKNSVLNQKNVDLTSSYGGLYSSVIGIDNTIAPHANASSIDCNNLYSSCNKGFDTNIGASGNGVTSSHNSHNTTAFQPNINFGTYPEFDYNLHKNSTNQYYTHTQQPIATMSGPSRTTHSSNPAVNPSPNVGSIKTANNFDAHTSSKTSVIKSVNAFNSTPLNYSKLMSPYAGYSTNKVMSSVEENNPLSSNSASNRTTYLSGTQNCKASEIYCPEPMSRYANHGFAVSNNVAPNITPHSHFLTSNYMSSYNHPLPRHQNRPSFPTQFDENPQPSNYYNTQNNSLVVRPTPNTYNKCQMSYQNPYNFGTRTNQTTSIQKPQPQKLESDPLTVTAATIPNDTYDRHYHHPYNSMYNANYNMDTYDDYQYGNFTASPTNSTFYPPKTSPKVVYNTYNSGLNIYNNSHSQPHAQPSTVQQTASNVPSSTQLISTNFDTNLIHPIIPNPIYNTNKDYYSSVANQHGTYQTPMMYSTVPTTNYHTTKSNVPVTGPTITHSSHHYDKSMQSPADKSNFIDLEEQINSSKILKSTTRNLSQCPKIPQLIPTNSIHSTKLPNNARENRNVTTCKRSTASQNNKNQYVYNYNAYDNCYQQQWQMNPVRAVNNHTKSVETRKKQNLRDFLSTWNEDEDEEVDANGKKLNRSNYSVSGGGNDPYYNYGKTYENNQIGNGQTIVQPQKNQQFQPFAIQPHTQNHDNNSQTQTMATPKIHVGITVDNGGNSSHNLPDIIIDIEKPKVTNDGECFERPNVIQEVPNSSEKLYILDSIDVPLADLNKYRHLSVVNKLPDNIVLPPENEIGVTESLKFIEEVESNHARYFKNDFEMNVEYDDDGNCSFDTKDLVECKNMTIVQNVKKIIRKYKKQREYRRKLKLSESKLCATPAGPVDLSLNNSVESLASIPSIDCQFSNIPVIAINDVIQTTSPFSNTENAPIDSIENNLSICMEDDAQFTIPFDSLKNICIKVVNTDDFRSYFNAKLTISNDDLKEDLKIPNDNHLIEVEEIVLDKQIENCKLNLSPVNSLKYLSMQAVRLNQFYLNVNTKLLKLPKEHEVDEKAISDAGTFRVKTLQELAREVANTIYSFNVKPLQDICKLAIEKYNQIFLESQMDVMQGLCATSK